MKSNIKFDLNDQNEAVITAKIVPTDDIRDKIAKQNTERLSYESMLAFVYCKHSNIGLVLGGKESLLEDNYSEWEIKTLSPYPDDSDWMAKRLSHVQLHNLYESIQKEIFYRNKGAYPIPLNNEPQKEYGVELDPRDIKYSKPQLFVKQNDDFVKYLY